MKIKQPYGTGNSIILHMTYSYTCIMYEMSLLSLSCISLTNVKDFCKIHLEIRCVVLCCERCYHIECNGRKSGFEAS